MNYSLNHFIFLDFFGYETAGGIREKYGLTGLAESGKFPRKGENYQS